MIFVHDFRVLDHCFEAVFVEYYLDAINRIGTTLFLQTPPKSSPNFISAPMTMVHGEWRTNHTSKKTDCIMSFKSYGLLD
jgi:hypothetical protein